MIAVDTNILVYAHRRDSPFHDRAAAVVRDLAEGVRPWAIPWPCVYEFYAIATNPRIYRPASSPEQAMAQIEAWFGSPTVVLLHDGEAVRPLLRSTLVGGHIVGAQVHDGRIAMICSVHGVTELLTADRDFSRFDLVKTRNPLLGS